MSMDVDYLDKPQVHSVVGVLPKQATPEDATFSMQVILSRVLNEIRHELLKLNPDVMTTTTVEGGNSITGPAFKRLYFELGGKPTKVYKVLLWNETGETIRVSPTG